MQFNDLLSRAAIDPRGVLIFRHRPFEPALRKVLPWLANERHDVFNAYQQTQTPKVEKAMHRAKFVASFIGHEAGKALYIGLYELTDSHSLSRQQIRQVPANKELTAFGMRGPAADRATIDWFDLELMEFHADWKGKLVVKWPGLERSWWRWADRNVIVIHAIHEDSILDRQMPEWNELALTWRELRVLPKRWCESLSQWRGIYFILDVSDGNGYVGAAYGKDNLLGRWLNYAASGHGGNRQLRTRRPEDLRFSILQRVSPDMEASDVIALESSWKDRLHTREFGMNDN